MRLSRRRRLSRPPHAQPRAGDRRRDLGDPREPHYLESVERGVADPAYDHVRRGVTDWRARVPRAADRYRGGPAWQFGQDRFARSVLDARKALLERFGGMPETTVQNTEWLYKLEQDTRHSLAIEGYFASEDELEAVLQGRKSNREITNYFRTAIRACNIIATTRFGSTYRSSATSIASSFGRATSGGAASFAREECRFYARRFARRSSTSKAICARRSKPPTWVSTPGFQSRQSLR